MAKIIRWDTPFTVKSFPSVVPLIITPPEGGVILKVIVAPDGTNQYPKYLVDFGFFIGYTCMEQGWAPERDFDFTMLEERNLSAYQYLDSPWLKAYERGRDFVAGGTTAPFRHYIIFGGDFNLEVITTTVPKIESIEQTVMMRIEHEV